MDSRNSYAHAILRGICIAGFTIWLSIMTTFVIWGISVTERSFLQEFEPYVLCIFCTAVLPFIFNSFALAFAYGDRRRIEEFLEREDRRVTLKGEMKRLFSSGTAIAELISVHLLLAVAALLGAFISFPKMWEGGMPVGNWLPAITLTPVFLILYLLSKYEAARYYSKLEKDGELEKLLTPRWLIIRIVILVILYPIVTPFAPIILYAGISAFSIIAKLSKIFTALGVVLGFLLLIFAFCGFKVLKGVLKRKKFYKRLRKTAADYGYELSEIKHPYRSFALSRSFASFSLKCEGKEFDCVCISTVWRGAALSFTSPTQACFLHRIGTKNHNFTLRHNIEFYHTGDGKRIIIVDPSPKNVIVSEFGKDVKLYCSDTIWGMTVHDADSFIGCMGRYCLDTSSKFQD